MDLPRELPKSIEPLADLALDLRWTWSRAGDALWRSIDAAIWEQTRNPWVMLQDVPRARLEALAADPTFTAELSRLVRAREQYMKEQSWFEAGGPGAPGESIAFFSMEWGLGEAVPLYAGGLGILAGDYLKTASDLGLPATGVGILFQEGYFRQTITGAGEQRESYPYNDPTALPVRPVTSSDGSRLRIRVELPGRDLWLRVWRARVGRVDLYLLDANDTANSPLDRGITAKLYGGGEETRLLQEIVLGIGGWRALHEAGVSATVAHLNEGHAAFVILERARLFMRGARASFFEALWATRAGNVFTTHTPVESGFDVFPPELMARYFPAFGAYLAELGISLPELLSLGRRDARDASEPFNMAFLAMRGSARTNAVSKPHKATSQHIFAGLFPRWPSWETPIDHVTNGVHVPSWDSREADALWTQAGGKRRWRGAIERLGEVVSTLGDEELWSMRRENRNALVEYARARLRRHLAQRGASPAQVEEGGRVLDPNILTLGFARRFTEYKRPNLLLVHEEWLARLLLDAKRPVQIVVAGKAHPDDAYGKRLVAAWVAFANRPDVRHRAVYLEDYDMALAEQLVCGVDVWINTPRRPWEACGTSGMKVLVNGGLNLSELDGWWAEAYSPDVGWALGEENDLDEAGALRSRLEHEVVPEFYDRDAAGMPRRWIARIRASMAKLTPTFSGNRMLCDYAAIYADATKDFAARAASNARAGKQLLAWQRALEAGFPKIRFGELIVRPHDGALVFHVTVHLGDIDPGAVRVELVADPQGDGPPLREPMEVAPGSAARGDLTFTATLVTSRGPEDFTCRVVPRDERARIPAELPLIAWQSR